MGYQPLPARTLLIDAQGSLPHIGTAVVLAATALETCILTALDRVASMRGINPNLWTWLNERGDYLKEPTVGERFDTLLTAVSGNTLKSEPALWEAFKNIREARNKFAHEGVARIGSTPLDEPKAAELIAKAGQIVDWVEAMLPEADRTPKFDLDEVRMETMIQLLGPESGATAG